MSNYEPSYKPGDIVRLFSEYPLLEPDFNVVVRIIEVNHKNAKYRYKFIVHNDKKYLNTYLDYDIMTVDMNSELTAPFISTNAIWREIND